MLEKLEFESIFSMFKLTPTLVDFMKFAKLDWSDRYYDLVQMA